MGIGVLLSWAAESELLVINLSSLGERIPIWEIEMQVLLAPLKLNYSNPNMQVLLAFFSLCLEQILQLDSA